MGAQAFSCKPVYPCDDSLEKLGLPNSFQFAYGTKVVQLKIKNKCEKVDLKSSFEKWMVGSLVRNRLKRNT